jgi:hypothetical protein
MAYSAVPTVSTGDYWTAANHNTYIRDNFAAGVPDIFTTAGDLVYATGANAAARLALGAAGSVLRAGASAPSWAPYVGCVTRRTSNQSIPNTTETAVSFTSEDFDSDAYHDNSTNPSRITIPSALGGTYWVYAGIKFDGNATGVRYIGIQKNGSGTNLARVDQDGTTQDQSLFVGQTMQLSASDYLEIYAYQSSGGALNILGDAGALFFGVDLVI